MVGTKFDIRRGEKSLNIAVLEGVVEVGHSDVVEEPTRVLTAGQQVTASLQGVVSPPQDVRLVQPGAWREGRLIYVDTALREVVADANRYSLTQVELANEEIGNIIVSTTFRTDEIDQAIASLIRALQLEAEQAGPDHIILHARPDAIL